MPLITGRTPHNPARLAATPLILDHAPNIAAPPDKLSRAGIVYQPRMGDNRDYPDCTAESLREYATAAAATLGGYQLNVARTASLSFYCRCVGLPANATADQIANSGGANMLDVAQWQWSSGFDTGYDDLRGLFGTVPTADRLRLAAAAATFGLGWWGIRLYQYDEDNLYSSAPLDYDGTDPGALVGLHAIGGAWEYTGLGDEDEAVIVTYGMFKPATWRWVAHRLDEAHAFVWPQLSPAANASVKTAGLEAALKVWAA